MYDPIYRQNYYREVTLKDPVLKENKRVRDNANRRRLREWLAAYKVSIGCVDCGYNKFACALQFDHLGKKTASISELRTSKARILKEIIDGKCVVRCANCHAVVTWRRQNDSVGT